MAELTLRLEIDPHTGKRTLVIAYESDADALPMEHEDEHRRLVEVLLESAPVAIERGGARPTATAGENPVAAAEEGELSTGQS